MAVGLSTPANLIAVPGIRLASAYAGLRNKTLDDVVLIELPVGSKVVASFTQNLFCAAPVTVAKQHSEATAPRYLLINAANANAGTGDQGMQNALASCQAVADRMGVASNTVLPFSTGVIGQQLPLTKIVDVLPDLQQGLSEDNWLAAAKGIMTTDTLPKAVSQQLTIGGKTITITGMAKGAGMICPNMATMLAYIATDANISAAALQQVHQLCVQQSFNRITVDGDTSTNDACVLMTSTAAGNAAIEPAAAEYAMFSQALQDVYTQLAQAIVRDGEGVNKFVSIKVIHGNAEQDCETIARTIAHSPLVKTALYASDANWGRILAAVGRAGVPIDIARVSLSINGVDILHNGQPHASYTEQRGSVAMQADELVIVVDLAAGDAEFTVWTTDLSHDYVSINADYRS